MAFLKYAVATNVVGSVAFLIVARFVAPDQHIRMVGPVPLMLVSLAAWLLILRGRLHAAVKALGIGVWMVITGVAAFNGGVRAPLVVAYPLVVRLVSRRAAVAAAALTVAAIIGLVLLESWSLLPYAPPAPPVLQGVVQVILVVLATLIVVFLVLAMKSA